MKAIVFPAAFVLTLCVSTTSVFSQCSSSRHCTTPRHRPYVSHYVPVAPPSELQREEVMPEDGDLEANDFESPVSVEVQVQHPTTFAWRTVKTFQDEASAANYMAQIQSRYWVIYTAQSRTKFMEARNLNDARSKANALRRSGMAIQSLQPMQVQIAEESLQGLFEEATTPVSLSQEPAVPNDLQPLLGLWEAVTRDANGEVNRILLDLHADGSAEMTVPTLAGGQVTVRRQFAVEGGDFRLKNGKQDLVLGRVVEAGPDKVVLDRDGSLITFLRP